MTVDTPLALFTTLFGWQFYNAIWDVLLGTGIALLPFLGALIEIFVTDREDGNTVGDSPEGQGKRLEAKFLIMLVVVAVAGQPTDFAGTSLGPDTLTYVPYATLLEPNPVTTTTSTSDSTFGETALGDFEDNIPVPIFWYMVMSVSQGVNRAVIAGLPELESIRDMIRLAQIANIDDPAVAAEARRFFSECYIPARSRFEREEIRGIDPDEIRFMGSDFYVQGDYQTRRARDKVEGFPFDAARDTELDPAFNHQAGKPFCDDWWLGNGAQGREGLRLELLNAAEESASGFTNGLAGLGAGLGIDAAEDIVIERILSNSAAEVSNDSFGTLGDGSVSSNIGRFVNSLGIGAGSSVFALVMDMVTLGGPMLQPMVLMGIFTLLPFAMVASRYSPSFLVGGSIVVFTVNFWPVLWYIATWADDNLNKALFPEDGFVSVDRFRLSADNLFFDTKSILLDMTTATLFLVLPLLFSTVMAAAGVRASAVAAGLTRGLSGGGDAAKAAGRGGQSIANIGVAKMPVKSKKSGG